MKRKLIIVGLVTTAAVAGLYAWRKYGRALLTKSTRSQNTQEQASSLPKQDNWAEFEDFNITIPASRSLSLTGDSITGATSGTKTLTIKPSHFPLKYGSKSDTVYWFQVLCNQLIARAQVNPPAGTSFIKEDGIWGNETETMAGQIFATPSTVATDEGSMVISSAVSRTSDASSNGEWEVTSLEQIYMLVKYISVYDTINK